MNKPASPHAPSQSVPTIGRIAGAGDMPPVLILIALIFWFLLIPCAVAQLYTGSVSGTVTDPSGAVISGANIALVDQEKGFSYTAKTDASGRYLLRSIPRENTESPWKLPTSKASAKRG